MSGENTVTVTGSEGEDAIATPSWTTKALKLSITLILVGFIIFVIVDSTQDQYVRSGMQSFLSWMEDNPTAGVFAFMFVYFTATVLFIPGSILTLGAGFVFANIYGLGVGVLLGTAVVFIGASLGSIAAFFLGRYLFRDNVEGLSRKFRVFSAIDTALEQNGLKILFLLRLSPIIPFNAINYILGLTSVTSFQYIVSLIGILPGSVVYVFVGSSASTIAESANSGGGNKVLSIVSIVVGVVLSIVVISITSYYVKKELVRLGVQEEEEDGEENALVDEEAANSYNSTTEVKR